MASYHTTTGNYAANNGYFANTGVDNAPVHLLQDGVSGGNGVYAYSASSSFPNNTYQSENYWVDVVFTVGGCWPHSAERKFDDAERVVQREWLSARP